MVVNLGFIRSLGPRWAPAAAMAVLVLLAGCTSWMAPDMPAPAAADDPPGGYSLTAARQVFRTGYEDISDIYIERKKISDLAIHGLQALGRIDKAVAIERNGDAVTVAVGGVATKYSAPSDFDAHGWGIVSASAIDFARSHSAELGKVDGERLYKVVFDAIIKDLDRFSRYAEPTLARENRDSREGFGGIGVELDIKNGVVRIDKVNPFTPAEDAGLRADDRILAVDGTPLQGADEHLVLELLRGEVGSPVDLTIERAGQSSFAKRLVRAPIIPRTVSYHLDPGNIAYFRLTGFNRQSTATMQRLLQQARTDANGKLAGIVLDLRNNPGGLLDQGVGVSDLFLRHGRILTTRGRVPENNKSFESSGQDVADGIPMVVLINQGSASAAEIVAAALQDLGRALLIGTRSFGKGTVQTVMRLPNEAELYLTSARFYAPSGYPLQGVGVVPNICTSASGASVPQVLADLRAGHVTMISAIVQRHGTDHFEQADQVALAAQCPASKQDTGDDSDLEIARAVLTERGLYSRLMRTFTIAAEGAGTQAAAVH